MNWTNLFTIAEAIAITIVFTRGSIFEKVRDNGPALWQRLAGCPLCAGVWIGAGWHLLREHFASTPTPPLSAFAFTIEHGLQTLGSAALTGVLAILVTNTLDYLDRGSSPSD